MKLLQRVILSLACLTIIFFLLSVSIDSSFIDFKNLNVKEHLIQILTFLTPLSILFAAITIWQVLKDSWEFKALMITIILAFGYWTFTYYFSIIFDFNSKQWQTINVTESTQNKGLVTLEQQKMYYGWPHITYKKRTVTAKSFLIIFWKTEQIIFQEDL